MKNNKLALAETLFRQHGPILKADFLREHGFYNRALAELVRNGHVQKLKTGYYIWNTTAPDVSDVETAAALVPFGIVCLQSAALLHELTTQNPLAVTIAIPSNRTRVALPEYPPVELVSSAMLTFGLGASNMGNIRVYDRERTVCDFFRKRRQLGDDLALEVLQAYMRGPRNLQTLFDYAGELRIKGVIKPYVEALI
jgi:predicted transcriptional regulator of viral defense system